MAHVVELSHPLVRHHLVQLRSDQTRPEEFRRLVSRLATILATGSEVWIAMEAREKLAQEGIPTAVVSMPCWELFDKQDEDYRRRVLGPATPRVAVEAAVRHLLDLFFQAPLETIGPAALQRPDGLTKSGRRSRGVDYILGPV